MTNWQEYYQQTKDRPPSPLLVKALPYVKNKGKALDLGAGAYHDSKFLATKFYKVDALDQELFIPVPEKVSMYVSKFENFKFPIEYYNLINAQYSLPFTNKEDFLKVWPNIIKALKPQGVFVGTLFGIDDEFAWHDNPNDMTFLTEKEVKDLCIYTEILRFKEEKVRRKLANGQWHSWHLFSLILKKI